MTVFVLMCASVIQLSLEQIVEEVSVVIVTDFSLDNNTTFLMFLL